MYQFLVNSTFCDQSSHFLHRLWGSVHQSGIKFLLKFFDLIWINVVLVLSTVKGYSKNHNFFNCWSTCGFSFSLYFWSIFRRGRKSGNADGGTFHESSNCKVLKKISRTTDSHRPHQLVLSKKKSVWIFALCVCLFVCC